MTAPTKNPIEDYLTSVLAGSMVGLLALHRDLDVDTLLSTDRADLCDLQHELVDLGLYPRELAAQSLNAIGSLLVHETNADSLVTTITDILWSVLGDPENGGQPPEIYRRAAIATHLVFIGLLIPSSFPNKSND